MNVECERKSAGCDMSSPEENRFLRPFFQEIALFCFLACFFSLGIISQAQIPNQPGANPLRNELSRLLKASEEARSSGDPVAIGHASERVLALALVQMARIRLDAKNYAQAFALCQRSLEFEDSTQTHLEMAIVGLYSKKYDDAIRQANVATGREPSNGLAWTVGGEALLQK